MEPSAGIMNSQSVKWGNNASLNSVDANKKVKGIKRHVIVDKISLLIVVSKRLVRSKDLGLGIITDTFNEKS